MKILLFILLLILLLILYYKNSSLLDKKYYTVNETFPYLNKIYDNLETYRNEVDMVINNKNWFDWVEKDLYKTIDEKNDWKIFPFFGFDIWNEPNCKKCPSITKFLKSIPGLKVAILSKMGPHTTLKEHQGWAAHSNNVLHL